MQTYEDHATFSLSWEDQEDWLLPEILEHQAKTYGDRTFLQWESTDETVSFEEMDQIANRHAHGFADQGVSAGDKVLLMLRNSLEYIHCWFGLSKLGGVEVPVNTDFKRHTLTHVANITEAEFAVFDAEFVPRLLEVEGDLEHLETVAIRGADDLSHPDSDLAFVAYDDIVSETTSAHDITYASQNVTAIIMTSGTTGPSKAIQKTYAHQYFFAEQCVNITQLTEEDVYLTANPLFHSNAQVLVVFPALIAGAKVCLFEEFSASNWVDRLQETGATVCNFLGSMMDFVFQQPERDIDDDNDLRCLFAAPTAYGIQEEFEKRYGIEYTTEVIGTTETCMPVLAPYGVERPEGAAGLLLSEYFDVQLVDPDTDWPVETGEMGEYAIRPKIPSIITPGYYGMPEKTEEAMRNCWFHTGDGLRRDDDGWFYFVDRIQDTLRRRGENISTYEVEQPLLDHPAIEECAVVGVKAEEHGGEDEVKAFVTFKDGQSASHEELYEWCVDALPKFMVPRYLERLEEMPKTSNEKIKKSDLRDIGNSERTWDREAER
jgi:crotonobetaine/carnitine-CoA ligase